MLLHICCAVAVWWGRAYRAQRNTARHALTWRRKGSGQRSALLRTAGVLGAGGCLAVARRCAQRRSTPEGRRPQEPSARGRGREGDLRHEAAVSVGVVVGQAILGLLCPRRVSGVSAAHRVGRSEENSMRDFAAQEHSIWAGRC
eukprot:906301-Rhodomonas_salina.2